MMNCPVCSVQLMMADRLGVEIDYCPKCRGVWLDRGELDKIIERTNDAAPTQYGVANYRRDDDDHDDHDDRNRYPDDPRRRKREGFFGRFFDFD